MTNTQKEVMFMDITTLAAAKKYTEDSLKGAGALKGQDGRGISSIYLHSQDIPIEGGDTDVTFAIKYTDNTTDYVHFIVPAGKVEY